MLMVYVGVTVIAVGIILILVGVAIAWGESKRLLGVKELTGFVNALTELVKAIADKRLSLSLFVFGTLLIVIGGVIAGVGGLSASAERRPDDMGARGDEPDTIRTTSHASFAPAPSPRQVYTSVLVWKHELDESRIKNVKHVDS